MLRRRQKRSEYRYVPSCDWKPNPNLSKEHGVPFLPRPHGRPLHELVAAGGGRLIDHEGYCYWISKVGGGHATVNIERLDDKDNWVAIGYYNDTEKPERSWEPTHFTHPIYKAVYEHGYAKGKEVFRSGVGDPVVDPTSVFGMGWNQGVYDTRELYADRLGLP